MRSRTKLNLAPTILKALFADAGIPDATDILPLGAGEFNAVFAARATAGSYAIKLAPPDTVPVMTYETGMMQAEVFWYQQMRDNTSIRVPAVYFADFEKKQVPAAYFIMEKLPGRQLDKMRLSKAEKEEAAAALASMAAQIHRIKNDRFGYLQTGLHANWYLAIRSMVRNLLQDCAAVGRDSKRGRALLQAIEQHKQVLAQAECCMVNFDIWPPNILVTRELNGLQYAWIDPERSFWGDPIVDFVCLEMLTPLHKKKNSLAAYNAVADSPVTGSDAEQIRYAVAQGYLGLIMEVEKYYRYAPWQFGWWRNVMASAMLYRQAFAVLRV